MEIPPETPTQTVDEDQDDARQKQLLEVYISLTSQKKIQDDHIKKIVEKHAPSKSKSS